jgi:hypothetical protein
MPEPPKIRCTQDIGSTTVTFTDLKESGRFWIDDGYVYGPRNSGKFWIDKGYIYDPSQSGRFWIDSQYIHGPSKDLPWLIA